ncbi:hypothetical protein BRC71_08155 [Halobacteriales archaeon QH_7_65_31]|nr:MAG: hypothetical protein BRC71_08155 [Halobacteriales archaeon QH_7_65_31]
MSDASDTYLFDVGVVALAHADTPIRENALEYVRAAVVGDIDAIVPRAAVVGAHHVLSSYLGHTNAEASRLLQNLLGARRIHWYEGMTESIVRDGLGRAGDANVGGWDGYYAEIALTEGVDTVVTIDDDFERFDGFETEVILSPEEFDQLNRFLDTGVAESA